MRAKLLIVGVSLCVLAIPLFAGEIFHPEAEVTGANGNPLPDQWTSDQGADQITTTISLDPNAETGGKLHLRISEDASDCGKQVQSPIIPVDGGSRVSLTYIWSGQGLYRDAGGSLASNGRVEVYFLTADQKFMEGAVNYHFDSSESESGNLDVVAPDGATSMRLRIGVSRTGESRGSASNFSIAQIKLSSKSE